MPELRRPDGVRLRWEVGGAGPLVVCLHGLGLTGNSFAALGRQLEDGYRILRLDQRGYGCSDDLAEVPELATFADDAAAVIEAEGTGGAHVLGNSFGALVALALARRRPELVRSLILISPTLGRGGGSKSAGDAWRRARLQLQPAAHRARTIAAPDAPARVLKQLEEELEQVRLRTHRAVVDIIAATDALPWLTELSGPVLVVAGSDDRVTGLPVADRVAASMGGRLVVVPGAGHAPQLERPDLVASVVRAFLEEVDGAPPLRIGICGAGGIATTVVEGILLGLAGPARVVGVAAREGSKRAGELAARASCPVLEEPSRLPAMGAEVVVEAAGVEAVRSFLMGWIADGTDVVILSVAALADGGFTRNLRRCLRENGRRVYVPAGGVAGLDCLRAAALGGLDRVLLRTTKPPVGLGLGAAVSRTAVFSGDALEGAKLFPQNLNVAAAIALGAGVPCQVELAVDPAAVHNRHHLVAEGAFGRLEAVTDNLPHPLNPRSSYLAGLSTLATLRRLREPLLVGC